MTLWRAVLRIDPAPGKRKMTVYEYVVLADDKATAEAKAVAHYRPRLDEAWIVTADPWDDDVVQRRVYLA